MSVLRFIRFILLCLLLFSISVLSHAAEEVEHWTPRDDDLRILEVRVEQYRLEDVLAAYQRKDMLLIPIGALAEILDLAVDVKPGDGIAEGFLFRERNTFYLDTSRNEVTIRGVTQSYNKNLVYVLDNDIYVDSNKLSDWFGIKINADLFSSSIKITSENPFPFIVRMEREERIARTRARLFSEQPDYPRHYEPYDMWNVPFIDQTFEATKRQGDGISSHTLRSTTFATAEKGLKGSI